MHKQMDTSFFDPETVIVNMSDSEKNELILEVVGSMFLSDDGPAFWSKNKQVGADHLMGITESLEKWSLVPPDDLEESQ